MNLVIDNVREDQGKTTCPQQGTRPRQSGYRALSVTLTREEGIIDEEEDIDGTAIEFRHLTNETMELMVTVGLISSISARWPELVQTSWIERMTTIREYVRQQVAEAQEFASSYD